MLIEKEKKPGKDEVSHRPIGILNVLGKLLEHLLLGRLKEKLRETGDYRKFNMGSRRVNLQSAH